MIHMEMGHFFFMVYPSSRSLPKPNLSTPLSGLSFGFCLYKPPLLVEKPTKQTNKQTNKQKEVFFSFGEIISQEYLAAVGPYKWGLGKGIESGALHSESKINLITPPRTEFFWPSTLPSQFLIVENGVICPFIHTQSSIEIRACC